MVCSMSAFSADWFPFHEVNHKWNLSINGGYNFEGKVGAYGFGLTIRGFNLILGGQTSTHKHDIEVGTWKESASAMGLLGYQIPITHTFRIIPVVGFSGIGEVITDGRDWEISGTHINNAISTDISYKFNYGANMVINHRSMIINFIATRYMVIGGIGLEF